MTMIWFVISGFRRDFDGVCALPGVTQRQMVILYNDVSGQHIGLIFKGNGHLDL
jgi:hypothetical protein